MTDTMTDLVARAIRDNIKCDATGLSPAVASVFLVGFREAAVAAIKAMEHCTPEMIDEGKRQLANGDVLNAWAGMVFVAGGGDPRELWEGDEPRTQSPPPV